MVGVRFSCAVPPFGVAVGTSTRTGAMAWAVEGGLIIVATLLVAVATATVVGVAVLGSAVLVGIGVAVAVGVVVGVSTTGAVGITVGSTWLVGDGTITGAAA